MIIEQQCHAPNVRPTRLTTTIGAVRWKL